MIKVTILYDENGYISYEAKGHAGYAEEQFDIICAAASVLMINTANSIESLTHDIVDEEAHDGYIRVEFPKGLSKDGNLLMDAMIIGLEEIQNNFEGKYLRIIKRRKNDAES